ncbi:hypothetical protein [Dankookia sp. P2]|uniref:hypothetical protein n=1 Tax=Dankookia sp. P2 TaxID=3423955 RepID=UPI003D66DB96
MRRVIAAYPGEPDSVPVDASLIHGMEGMRQGGGHGAMPMPPAGAAVPRPQPLAPLAGSGASRHRAAGRGAARRP